MQAVAIEYLEEYELYLHDQESPKNTIEKRMRDIKHFFSIIHKKVHEVDNVSIWQYRKTSKENDLSKNTITGRLRSLSAFYNFIEEQFGLSLNLDIDHYETEPYLSRILSQEEFFKMVKITEEDNDYRAKAILLTIYYTGLKAEEVTQLKVIDTENLVIEINRKKKNVNPELKNAWDEYLKVRQSVSEYLFTGQRGRINRHTVFHIIKKYAKKANIKEELAHAEAIKDLCILRLMQKGHSHNSAEHYVKKGI